MSGYDEIKRNIAKMIEKGKYSASTSDATYYDKETRSYYSVSDIKKLKEINEVKLAEIESLKYLGVSDNDGKITSRKTTIKTNEGVIKRIKEHFGIIGDIISDTEREAAFNDVMNLIDNESDNELGTDDSISYSSSISSLSNATSNNTSETNSLGEGEQQHANTDNIQVAETSEHENNNNNLMRSGTLLHESDNRNNLDRRGYGQHPDTGTLSRSNNVMGVSNSWAASRFYDGPSPAKKDVTKLKKFGNFIKRTFKTK